MKYLVILFMFFTSTVFAEIKLIAPDSCVIGELVRLDATESDSKDLVWEIIPATKDFEAIGKKAFFSSRKGGEFLLILAGSEDGKPVLKTHLIKVISESESSSLDFRIKELLKKVIGSREEAIKLAQSFRTIATTEVSVEYFLESTAKANRAALGNSLEVWKKFLDGLGLILDDLRAVGELKTQTDYQRIWNLIADSIEKHIK